VLQETLAQLEPRELLVQLALQFLPGQVLEQFKALA
jgi:hypothetical protein